MDKDGFAIPFETFFGLNGEKEPDIDLNFSSEEQWKAHEFVREKFGDDHVFRAGTIGMLSERNAEKYTCQYFLDHHLGPESGEAESVKEKLSYAVKTTTGQHTAGLVIVPENRDISAIRSPAVSATAFLPTDAVSLC